MARILFLDDDPLTLQLLDKASRLLGHEAIVATNAPLALTLIYSEHPDLVLADMNLPGCDGLAFLKEVRAGDRELPVLIVSAGLGADETRQVMDAGANGTIDKPLGLDQLAAIITQYLG
ncbi:MAG TPA: response regulator [Anaerolineaceae bacterium]|nr:response regulator [Anaerolineaceae bacterium]